MNIEEIISNLNLSKERIPYSTKKSGVLLFKSQEESVRELLNKYIENPDETVWLFGDVRRIKNMDEDYIRKQITFLEVLNHGTPYNIAWSVIFRDLLNKRRSEKINKIRKKMYI